MSTLARSVMKRHREILNECLVELRNEAEVELLDRLVEAEAARRTRMLNFFCSRRATSSWISSARKSVWRASPGPPSSWQPQRGEVEDRGGYRVSGGA